VRQNELEYHFSGEKKSKIILFSQMTCFDLESSMNRKIQVSILPIIIILTISTINPEKLIMFRIFT